MGMSAPARARAPSGARRDDWEETDGIVGARPVRGRAQGQGRSMVLARRGLVATDHPLASVAGLRVLQDGGNAIDAAVCTAAVLGVVTPMMTGIGGDSFILYYEASTNRVMALTGSGAAPRGASPEDFRGRGHQTVPLRGMLSPSVPGAVDAMMTALGQWGSGRWTLGQ